MSNNESQSLPIGETIEVPLDAVEVEGAASLEEQAVLSGLGLMKAGQIFYDEKADPDEVNLVKVVRDRLFEKGINEEKLAACFDSSNFVQEAEGRHTHAQQWNLTRWVDEQFTLIQAQDGVDTRLFRYQAIYEVQPDVWLKVFNDGILPNLAEFGIRERK